MGNNFEQWKREPSSHLLAGIRLTLFYQVHVKVEKNITETQGRNDHMDHFEEGASWENHAPPKCGICSHFYSVTQVGLEKCVILLHIPKLVIISKGENTILLSSFPRNENCMKLKCNSNVIDFVFYLIHWTSCRNPKFKSIYENYKKYWIFISIIMS